MCVCVCGCTQYFLRYATRSVAPPVSSSPSSSSSSPSLLFVSTICVSKSRASPTASDYSQWMNSCSRPIDSPIPLRAVSSYMYFRTRQSFALSTSIKSYHRGFARERNSEDSGGGGEGACQKKARVRGVAEIFPNKWERHGRSSR